MLRLGGLTTGNMQQCVEELNESSLPDDFKLRQIRSLLRYLREVSGFVDHVKSESGFEGDTVSYLEILCAKEDSDLVRRVSHTRVLRQDFDEKRREWRKQKKCVIKAIGSMTARALRFEDKERKTVALYALEFYKNIMGRDNGAILGESESTDSLTEQYRRHRDEISKIPMYADNIVKMLNNIRKTVRASAKLQPGSNAFAQFLDEWWSSVVEFLQHSSIVDAENNAREVMQTLKKLKSKQEDNKKKEMSRLLAKLDAQAGLAPPVGRLSELFLDNSDNPEDTTRSKWRDDVRAAQAPVPFNQKYVSDAPRRSDRSSRDSSSSEIGRNLVLRETQRSNHGSSNADIVSNRAVRGSGAGHRVSFDCDDVRSSRHSVLSLGAGSTASAISSGWEDGSIGTTGTSAGRMSGVSVDGVGLPALSGLPCDSSSEGGLGDDEDDDVFEAADNLDLGAVDLCATGEGADGEMTYGDQEDAREAPSLSMSRTTVKKDLEKERFSAALDFFRQEQHRRGIGRVGPPRSPMNAAGLRSPPSPLTFNSKSINPQAAVQSTGVSPRPGGVNPRVSPRPRFPATTAAKPHKRRVSASERERAARRDNVPADFLAKSSARTLSLYIPRHQKVGNASKYRPSKAPTAASSSRRPGTLGLSPSGGSCRFTRSAFFA